MTIDAHVDRLLDQFAEETDPEVLDQIENKIKRLRALSTS